MVRDMAAGDAFAASEDADSEGEEGKFYVWTEAEIDALLGADAPVFKAAYDVTPEGNWEDHTILRRITEAGTPEQEAALARCRDVLFQARAKRVRPGTRRQGSGRLERPGHRRPGPRCRGVRAPGLARSRRRRPRTPFYATLARRTDG